jgi:hypothetical protein
MTTENRLKTILCTCVFVVLGLCRSLLAEHFNIDLTVESGHEKGEGHADTSPPLQGNNPRAVCHAKRDDLIVMQFFFRSNFPHDPIKNVTVRYYITPLQKQGADPDVSAATVVSGNFVMDFKPKSDQDPGGKVGLRQQFHLSKPGPYLVRVQSENSDSDHEHFAAVDLIVE